MKTPPRHLHLQCTHQSQFKEESDNHDHEKSPTGFHSRHQFSSEKTKPPHDGAPSHVGVTATTNENSAVAGLYCPRQKVRGVGQLFLDWVDLPFPFHALTGQRARERGLSLTAAPAMERSWGVESLDSLWFFGNVLSRARPSPSVAEEEETEEKEGGGGGQPVKNEAHGPEDEAEAARAKPVAQSSENSLPRCPGCGNLDAGAAELSLGRMESSAVEAVGTPESAEEESTLKERMRRSKRRQRSRRTFRGELDLGCDGKDLSGFEENRFLGNHRRGFGAASEMRAMKKKMLPPLSDGVAMREHLRSWAIAVALCCQVVVHESVVM